MILRDGMQQTEVSVYQLVGQRCVSATLFAADVRHLASMSPNQLHEWLTTSLQTRFAPTKMEGED